MSDSLLVIVNNAAARARRAWPGTKAALEASGVRFDVHETTHAGDAVERTRAALLSGVRTVAAVGGDGTLSEVASGFFEPCGAVREGELPRVINSSASLAVLPSGTGDDFARGLQGGRRAPLGAWVERLVRHFRAGEEGIGVAGDDETTTRRVDVLYGAAEGARRFICLNAATLGIGAEVAAHVAAQRGAVQRLSGEARFALAAVKSLVAWRERSVRLRVDEGAWRNCRTNLIAIVNGAYAGGGMNFSPDASTGDGLLDVVIACDISRAVLLRELTRIHRGGHIANPKVSIARGTRVRIEALDGEALAVEADGDVRGQLPVEFRVIPSALRVVW